MIDGLSHAESGVRRAAFDELADRYGEPVRGYLRRRWQLSAADADDLAQSLLAQLWSREHGPGFDATRGRFRTWLRACVDHLARNHARAGQALRRGGGAIVLSLDATVHGDARDASPALTLADVLADPQPEADAAFGDEVVRNLLARAVARLRDELAARNRAIVFEVFRLYELEGEGERRYAEVAQALGLPVTQLTNHLHAARQRLRAIALEELRSLCASDAEFRDEAAELLGVRLSSR